MRNKLNSSTANILHHTKAFTKKTLSVKCRLALRRHLQVSFPDADRTNGTDVVAIP